MSAPQMDNNAPRDSSTQLNGPNENAQRMNFTVATVQKSNIDACKCFAVFSRSYKAYKASRSWFEKLPWRKSQERSIYHRVSHQGYAYISAISETFHVAEIDRAICYDIASRLSSGDPIERIEPQMTLQISVIHREAKQVEEALRAIRVDILKLRQDGGVYSLSPEVTEAPNSEEGFAELEKRATHDFVAFTKDLLDIILLAVCAFITWWDERIQRALSMRTRANVMAAGEYGPQDVEALTEFWWDAEREYGLYISQTKIEHDYIKALLKGIGKQ